MTQPGGSSGRSSGIGGTGRPGNSLHRLLKSRKRRTRTLPPDQLLSDKPAAALVPGLPHRRPPDMERAELVADHVGKIETAIVARLIAHAAGNGHGSIGEAIKTHPVTYPTGGHS